MAESPVSTVDVQGMLCAQALAVVAKAAARLGVGETMLVRYGTDDVKQDLLMWARERRYHVIEKPPMMLQFTRTEQGNV